MVFLKRCLVKASEINALASRVYEFVDDTVLAPLGWQPFSDIVAQWRESRDDIPTIFFDVFPTLACTLAGGDQEQGVPLGAAWLLLLIGARVFDDLQDNEGPAQPWLPSSLRIALPTGLYALGAANLAISQLPVPSDALADIANAFSRALALAAKAQVEQPLLGELAVDWYFENIAARTGLIVATGAWAGARVSSTKPDPALLNAFYDYGLALGMMTQILDDIVDLATADLAAGRYTLPVIFGLAQAHHPLRLQLGTLLENPESGDHWVQRVTAILKEMGAIAWSLEVAFVYQERAINALAFLPKEQIAPLVGYARRDYAFAF